MIKRIVLLALLLAAPVLNAQSAPTAQADFTGTWTGPFNITMDGQERADSAHMVLTQKGTELTGSVGPSAEQQFPIQKGGKVEGTSATFDVQSDGPLVHFTVKLVDGHLMGDAKAEADGHTFSGKLDLERKKQ